MQNITKVLSALKLNDSAFKLMMPALRLTDLALEHCYIWLKLNDSAFKLDNMALKLHCVALSSRLQLSSSMVNPLSSMTWN